MIEKLRKAAAKATKFRRHSIRWGEPYGNATTQRFSQHGECRFCGMGVWLDTHPAPNGIDIAGEAVALSCSGDVKFRSLPEGARFVFSSERHISGMAKGPWIKTGPRTYRHEDERQHMQRVTVGSINVQVVKM
jgi:hypothetical protein